MQEHNWILICSIPHTTSWCSLCGVLREGDEDLGDDISYARPGVDIGEDASKWSQTGVEPPCLRSSYAAEAKQ